jgi:hypothetical protein
MVPLVGLISIDKEPTMNTKYLLTMGKHKQEVEALTPEAINSFVSNIKGVDADITERDLVGARYASSSTIPFWQNKRVAVFLSVQACPQ